MQTIVTPLTCNVQILISKNLCARSINNSFPPPGLPGGKAYKSNSWTHELRTMAARFEKTGPTVQAFAPHILEA